jgi:uncharacterized protein YjbI with pentapeptide repeats
MKSENSLYDYINEQVVSEYLAILRHPSDNFSEIAKDHCLDPLNDFRFADLRGVDFSFADLRHHDFTGADLSGCYGFAVRFDATTKLTGATTENSIFASAAARGEVLRSRSRRATRVAEDKILVLDRCYQVG